MSDPTAPEDDASPARSAPQNRIRGRFSSAADALMDAYGSSIEQDRGLIRPDIRGSIAHAAMLGRQGIIPRSAAEANVRALHELAADAEAGRFRLREEHEDVHMNVEAELERRIGAPARMLHTARSRNDQVVTDFRMLVRDGARETGAALGDLQAVLLDLAEQHIDTIMPGYTHLQVAQPVVLAHHLMAYWQMLRRDRRRFAAAALTASELPLGSAALAGSPYPLDRESVAHDLGFASISANSMDAVSARDFLLEFLSAAAICMANLSRLAEEIVLWSTREFGFISLDDSFATGSSIMPQKKNPDVAELARGRTGLIFGNLMAALTMMKALPLTYNRDLQNDKPPYLQAQENLLSTIRIFTAMLPTITWNKPRMRSAAVAGYSLATDVADYLVGKGLPFREAHEAVGALVASAVAEGSDLHELGLDIYRRFSDLFEPDVLLITAETSVDSRNVPGGTARTRVREQIQQARAWLAEEDAVGTGD